MDLVVKLHGGEQKLKSCCEALHLFVRFCFVLDPITLQPVDGQISKLQRLAQMTCSKSGEFASLKLFC